MTLPITDFIIERLLEFDPTYDVGAGTATTGLLVEPLAIILQPVIDELTVMQATQSILTILESSDPDAFPEDIVDGLASNVFVERQPGNIGSTTERIRFFEPQAFSASKGVLVFRGPAGQRFTNSEAISVTKAEMALNQDGSLYFIDVPIIALEEGSGFNVDVGTIITMETEPAGVANATNLFKVDQGRDRETNTELIDRIKVAVTVRALVTGRGIVVTLTENFTSIVEIQPIGFGDPEMMRDIVYNVHIGGNVDVYIRAAAFTDSSKDVFGLEIDTTRQHAGSSVVICPVAGTPVSLINSNLDRTNVAPIVKSIDDLVTFVEGVDYTLDDLAGTITRIGAGTIIHLAVVGTATILVDGKTLNSIGSFGSARSGMIITVTNPAGPVGVYTIKTVIDVDNVEIYGFFAGGAFPVAAVSFEMDDNLEVIYEYNPVSIDIIATSRSPARDDFTITEVPVMLIVSVETLDPLSGEPTGVFLTGEGGYGIGGFGMGGYGIGSGPDWRLVVNESTLRFSAREDNYLEFKQSFVGVSVRVTYKWASVVPTVQAFCDDRDNQSETASLLARHFIPVFVESRQDIEYDIPASTQETAPTVTEMTVTVTEFIDDIDEGRPLELSDIVDLLYDNGAVEVDLDGLQKLRGAIHHEDGSIEFVVPTVKGVMSIPSLPIPDPTDKPLSPQIARFVTRDVVLKRNVV